ncbi:DsbA family protein [Bailinhaonella thermotolerans]|uniref:Thioredoxin-like fold domain-containing protein n=1 Tax=Bailinhaonella thermotolerans TaxID=1070861 RepID=A0A3A4A6D2_9ACTN|nr:thioredoxin domain-containing protein [Bailinhaonella thermotolerans]RJL21261.1 hypothetical protein D5H75_38025 [Bailinhaonella thermotolerans]
MPTLTRGTPVWVVAARFIVAGELALSALARIGAGPEHTGAWLAYGVLPDAAARSISHALPFAGLALAFLLARGAAVRLCAWAAAAVAAVALAMATHFAISGAEQDLWLAGVRLTTGGAGDALLIAGYAALLSGCLIVALRPSPAVPAAAQAGPDGPRGDRSGRPAWATLAGAALLGMVVQPAAHAHFAARPPGTAPGGGVRIGPDGAGPLVEVYTDYQSPQSRRFEAAAGRNLRAMAAQGRIRLRLVDLALNGGASAEAALAASCALKTGGPPAYLAARDALLAAELRNTDPAGARTAITAAVSPPRGWSACVRRRGYLPAVEDATRRAFRSGVRDVPAVRVNGTRSRAMTWATLRAEIAAARP